MRIPSKRGLLLGAVVLAAVGGIAAVGWLSLTHKPRFYQAMVAVPHAQQEVKAKRFVAHSLQLSNDIRNEPTWEASFSDQEVNAWLAEDLVTHFADQLPREVHQPRVMFEVDRVTLAFEFDHGPVRSVIWVVARPRVPESNVLELSLEKIRAGMLPIPAEQVLERITQHARAQGLDIEWKREGDLRVAVIRYTPHTNRDDVRLEKLQIRKGEIRLAGRSDRRRGVVDSPTLPTRKVLQSKFPRRKIQVGRGRLPSSEHPAPSTALRSSAMPTS
ncbi:MAG: hypothetical protein NVSMB9_23590 [Isosphaeraceae bacterium]